MVRIVQPVIPRYRVSLFEALANRAEFSLEVHASKSLAGAPSSVTDVPHWGDLSHDSIALFGGRLFWQKGLSIPASFGQGDVLVLTGNPRFLSNLPIALQARRQGVGIVWWGHGWSPTSVAWRASIRYRLMQLVDVVLLYTDEEVEALSTVLNSDKPVLALNNTLDLIPIDEAKASWTAERLATFRGSNNLEGRTVLLFCGRLRSDPDTELDVAIKALAELSSNEPAARYVLVVIGEGEQRERFEALANALKVNDRILWQGAIYEEEDLAPWFLTASCFVFPGPIGLSLIHAFAYGLPVVTHADRRLHGPEIAALKQRENGLVFERGNAVDLSRQLSVIGSDAELARRLSVAARQTVSDEFSFSEMVSRFVRAIDVAARTSSSK
jgi:glycosyltransferase involved in cell wall biosynthesis